LLVLFHITYMPYLKNHTPLFFLALLIFTCTIDPVAAQSPGVTAHESTLEQLQSKRSAIEASATLDDNAKTKIIEHYGQAITARTQTNEIHTKLAQLRSLIAAAPKRIDKIRKLMAKPLKAYDPLKKLSKNASADEIESLLRQEEEAFNALREALKKHTDDLTLQLNIATTISQESADRTSKLGQIESDLKTPPPPDEITAVTDARREALLARKGLREAELDFYKQQLDNHELLTSLSMAERDLAAREDNHRLSGLEALRSASQRLREATATKAKQQAERAHEETADLPDAIRAIAEKNVSLSSELEELTRKESQVAARLDSTFRQLEEIKSEADSTRQRVEIVGSSEAIGRMLRKRHEALPSLERYQRDASERRSEINRATDRQIDIEELRRDLLEIGHQVENIILEIEQSAADTEADINVEPKLQDKEKTQLSTQAHQLLLAQRDAFTEQHRIYGRYIAQLTALDVAERQLVAEAETFAQFIREHLIWIRSTSPVAFSDLAKLPSGLLWLASPGSWLQIINDLLSSIRQEPGVSFLGLLGVIILFVLRQHAAHNFPLIAQKTKKFHTDSFLLTLQALWHTFVLASAWPAVILVLAWRLNALPTAATYTAAISNGLFAAAIMLITISFFRQMCQPEGLADRHFRWPKQISQKLLQELRWLMAAAPPLVFIIAATAVAGQEPHIQGLGRPAFILMMLAVLIFVAHILKPSGVVQAHLLETRAGGILTQLRLTWFPLTLFLPLSLIIISVSGYHYTALTMEHHLQLTVWFFLGLMVLKDLLLRSIYLVERRFRYEEAIRKRDELRAQREKEALDASEEKDSPPIELPEIEYEEVDYEQLGEQAKRLIKTGLLLGIAVGLWNIWADLMPAFNVLEAVKLPFTSTELIDGVEKSVPITLADLGLALLFLAITIIATKNLPGVMEIVLLQRLPLDPGARFAIKALTQYLIVAVGTIAAFNTIGAEWSSIQWLIAALSVGLGFGLQEIVANFISGIILLFERPIRVGDTVTVGDITGKVSRIRIRATTIMSWDKQELLVPNKEFITGRLLNWTLTDQMIRIIVPVGIAYGSDVDRAIRLLAEVAEENEHVLKEPAPLVSFDEFGDNALTLRLRCYLGSLEYRLETITALHRAINNRFNDAKIAIAFPQRDIHLDTTKPLDIRLSRAPKPVK